jgi:desulfoferrodoxin (superoxide reductase-like protein)
VLKGAGENENKEGEMKRVGLLVILFFAAALACAYAHMPSDVKVSFDTASKELKLVIMHDTPDLLVHYIGRVNVELNGKEVINDKLTRQENDKSQTLIYKIPNAKAGDIITVYVRCNIIGRLKREIKVE